MTRPWHGLTAQGRAVLLALTLFAGAAFLVGLAPLGWMLTIAAASVVTGGILGAPIVPIGLLALGAYIGAYFAGTDRPVLGAIAFLGFGLTAALGLYDDEGDGR